MAPVPLPGLYSGLTFFYHVRQGPAEKRSLLLSHYWIDLMNTDAQHMLTAGVAVVVPVSIISFDLVRPGRFIDGHTPGALA